MPDTDTHLEAAIRAGVEAGRTDAELAEDLGRPQSEVARVRRGLKLQAQRARKPDAADGRLDLRIPPAEIAILDAHVAKVGGSRASAIRTWIRSLG